MFDLNPVFRRAAHRDADVGVAMQDAARALGRRVHAQVELDAGVLLHEVADQPPQELHRKAFCRGDAHPPALHALQRLDVVNHTLRIVGRLGRVDRQHLCRAEDAWVRWGLASMERSWFHAPRRCSEPSWDWRTEARQTTRKVVTKGRMVAQQGFD